MGIGLLVWPLDTAHLINPSKHTCRTEMASRLRIWAHSSKVGLVAIELGVLALFITVLTAAFGGLAAPPMLSRENRQGERCILAARTCSMAKT